MTPTRLPRPGQVVEPCRLCGAPLEISVENPRRVCAACGEINLPGDAPPPDPDQAKLALPNLSIDVGLPRTILSPTGVERWAPFAAAAAPMLSVLGAFLRAWASGRWRPGDLSWLLSVGFFLPPITLVAFVIGVVLMNRPRASKVTVGMFWVLGYASGLAITGVLVYAYLLLGAFLR